MNVVVIGTDSCALRYRPPQSIAHIVDHALSLERNPSTPPEECYTLDAMLRSDDLDRPVRYPTSRFASGWAIRLLTCDEIGVAFGLPSASGCPTLRGARASGSART
eukprot:scaffold8481_cov33-Attheya_sp.AAC.9